MSLKSIGQYGNHLRRCKYDKVRFGCKGTALIPDPKVAVRLLLPRRGDQGASFPLGVQANISGKNHSHRLPYPEDISGPRCMGHVVPGAGPGPCLRTDHLPVTCLQVNPAADLLRLRDRLGWTTESFKPPVCA